MVKFQSLIASEISSNFRKFGIDVFTTDLIELIENENRIQLHGRWCVYVQLLVWHYEAKWMEG